MLNPKNTAAAVRRLFKRARKVRRTKNESTDSEEPRVEIENTIGLRRWTAVYNVACLLILKSEAGSVPFELLPFGGDLWVMGRM